MRLGKVLGTVVASQKDEKLKGLKFLIVQKIDCNCKPEESTIIAADTVGAGVGEVVLYTTGGSSRFTVATHEAAVDNTIVAIVDSVEVGKKRTYEKAREI